MWDFNQECLRRRAIDEEPLVAEFLSGLIVERPGLLDINRSVLTRYGMRALPLIDWDLSCSAQPLFEVLTRAGARKGYFVEYPSDTISPSNFLECVLTLEVAQTISDQALFEWDLIFFDDKFCCSIVPWYSDFVYFCMVPALFEEYLSADPITTDWQDCEAGVAADNFQDALRGAFQRLKDFERFFQRPDSTYSVRAELEWQLTGKP